MTSLTEALISNYTRTLLPTFSSFLLPFVLSPEDWNRRSLRLDPFPFVSPLPLALRPLFPFPLPDISLTSFFAGFSADKDGAGLSVHKSSQLPSRRAHGRLLFFSLS